ncbi:hypothetical protein M9979_10520 [Sphingomonas sp. RP10(2022)]|uniref:Uncharacterized protein n=1 Tax=Sphingomonas liriopis TaxID=2949094 RepID=A0A9X2HXM1_9SPHN|nr:hypothetical protein [Sphingomonas liriopis]MCP3735304.1 hypothetical protein [Sphingomonas liriopis]
MRLRSLFLPLAAVALACGVPAAAGNKLVVAGQRIAVAKSAMTVLPTSEWNRLGARPGRAAETWTLDGDALNDLTFYGGIESGRPLFREVSRKTKPLPTVSTTMLVTDIPALLENSYRIALGTASMTIGTIEPATFAGAKGVHFTYSFVRQDDTLRRRGEGRGAMIGGRLYLITYEAPALYYYDRSAAAARQVAESAQL